MNITWIILTVAGGICIAAAVLCQLRRIPAWFIPAFAGLALWATADLASGYGIAGIIQLALAAAVAFFGWPRKRPS